MVYVPAYLEDDGRIPPQGGIQVDWAEAKEEYRWEMGLTLIEIGDGGGWPTGG